MGRIAIDGFSGDLLDSTDPGYDDARRLWNAMFDKRPAVIARCRTSRDVAAAVRHARTEGLEVAVRGGGHSVAGLSCTDGGVMIDLQLMQDVIVDADARRARVPGGTLLGRFDAATHPHGLATTGGMVHHTGVGGLTLGGGFGWLARLHGLSCDNLASAEVVTAGGDIVRASDTENADLFWGLRGGGGNFGIVTEFEFRLHPIRPMLSVELRYAARDAPAVLRTYRELMASAPDTLCSLVGMDAGRGAGQLEDAGAGTGGDGGSNGNGNGTGSGNGRGSGTASGELYVWYAFAGSDLDEGTRLGAPLRDVARRTAEHARVLSYRELQSATGAASGPGRRHYWKGALMRELSDEFLDAFLERGRKTVGTGCGIELFSLGGAIARVGEEDTAYSNRSAAFDLLPAATWDDPADDARNITLTRENWDALVPFARAGVYVNDLGADAAERMREVYGAATFDRLAALKQTWDPDNLFRLNANIAPAKAGRPRA